MNTDAMKELGELIARFEEQKNEIYSHYERWVISVKDGEITAEADIERIMDGLIDFGDDDRFRALYKDLCRYVYDYYPQLIGEHINLFRMQFDY